MLPDEDFVDPRSVPDVNSTLSSLFQGDESKFPEVELPGDCYVSLPGGFSVDDRVIHDAEVRELTGEDEEALAKVVRKQSVYKMISALLTRGVVSVGELPVTPQMLRTMLVGDRDALILGIRRATFGSDVEIERFRCPACGEFTDVTMSIDDIPMRKLSDLDDDVIYDDADHVFSVVLPRSKRTALVRLPTGADLEKTLDNPNWTVAEQNTVMLSAIVVGFIEPDGTTTFTRGASEPVLKLGLKDRSHILEFLAKVQPGPRYDEVKFTHEVCGEEVEIPLTVADLFREL